MDEKRNERSDSEEYLNLRWRSAILDSIKLWHHLEKMINPQYSLSIYSIRHGF